MKHSRFTAASYAAVLSPLVGLAASLMGALPARGVDVPFTERVISTAARSAWSVFATDLDGDGDTDVLSASWEDNKIAWYENDGGSQPSFTERVISTATDVPVSVLATDVDGDGDTDVLSASWRDDKIAWYESDGGSPPTFTERVISTTADGAECVFATDLDGDGDTDVLSASSWDDKIAWYESDGSSPPAFTERVISTAADGAVSVFATDMDGDGDTDVLSASAGDDKIAWYESDGGSPPTFTERVISTAANAAVSVFATDMDGDGDTDVLSASLYDDKIAWYESDGGSPPTFSERVISSTADRAWSVIATDVDGDGDTDVLSASAWWREGKIAWYESDGGSPPTFTEKKISTAAWGARSVFATDLDGDGDADVLSASEYDGKIAWYENTPPPPPLAFTERVISTGAEWAWSVFAADLDGDGDIDVLSASRYDHRIAWYESHGGSPPTFTERVISTTALGANSVFATDLDDDGDTDVLSASWRDDKIAWYESDGGSPPSFTERVISTAADGAESVFATDMDGDGDTDVLSASRYDDKIAWYDSDGGSPPSFTERVISSAADFAQSVFAMDVDGDGDTDVLSASRYDDKIAWYENDGLSPPTFTERVITEDPDGRGGVQGFANGAVSVFATDLDSDGDTDVLSASFDDDKIAWYDSDGGSPPTFTERVISTTAFGANSVFAADLDGDGDADVLSASFYAHKIAWYQNDGGSPPSFTEWVISIAADFAESIFATDMDGDGDTDVLSAGGHDDDKIAWYENTTCGDGLVEGAEECDPPDRDCCDALCLLEPPGTSCTDDGDPCTDDTCIDSECVHTPRPGCVVVRLDIKPGSCPNPVNPRSMGVVPMAILGSESFDVMQIDLDSLTLARADGVGGIAPTLTERHGPRPRFNDVAAPVEGEPCACHQPGGDGIDDLLLKISTPELTEALELRSLARGASVMLTLSGSLLDGTEFEAYDCVVIRGKSEIEVCHRDVECDDGDLCTDDTCFVSGCSNTPVDCEDGLFCTGVETCDPTTGGCLSSGDPCPGLFCDERADRCVECISESDCDDGQFCTGTETCTGGVCVRSEDDRCSGPDGDGNCAESCDEAANGCTAADPDGSICDDSLFCTETDACSGGDCIGSGSPCPRFCDEITGCFDCLTNLDCDDEVACTDDICDLIGLCIFFPNSTNCDDADLCTVDTCDAVTGCSNLEVVCEGGEFCSPATGECEPMLCGAPEDCDDADACTDDTCAPDGTCRNTVVDCDDGLFCSGVEQCDSETGCVLGLEPCADDGIDCTDDCDELADECTNTPNDDLCTDDGVFCNGSEMCDPVAGCISPGDPCPPGDTCIGSSQACDTQPSTWSSTQTLLPETAYSPPESYELDASRQLTMAHLGLSEANLRLVFPTADITVLATDVLPGQDTLMYRTEQEVGPVTRITTQTLTINDFHLSFTRVGDAFTATWAFDYIVADTDNPIFGPDEIRQFAGTQSGDVSEDGSMITWTSVEGTRCTLDQGICNNPVELTEINFPLGMWTRN